MRIGELAARASCSRDTIRFYERKGLLRPSRRRAGTSSYREYDEAALRRLRLIQRAKALGFTLVEIAALADAWESDRLTREEKTSLFREKVALIDARIADLRRVRRELADKLKALRSGGSKRSASRAAAAKPPIRAPRAS